MRIIYTAGVFDLLHYGHRHIIRESRKLGDRLIVGVVADASYKGVTPEWPLERRLREVSALREVDLAVVQPSTDPTPVLSRLAWLGLEVEVMTHGNDWAALREGMDTLRGMEIEFQTIPVLGGISSTEIRAAVERMREGGAMAEGQEGRA